VHLSFCVVTLPTLLCKSGTSPLGILPVSAFAGLKAVSNPTVFAFRSPAVTTRPIFRTHTRSSATLPEITAKRSTRRSAANVNQLLRQATRAKLIQLLKRLAALSDVQ